MGRISKVIGASAFEKIRDRIYEIVVDELYQQAAITYDDDFLDATVYLERFVPFQLPEMPAVNISFVSGDSDKETKNTAWREYRYNIDFYGSSPTTNESRGDLRASMRVQRLMAVVDAILRDKRYITLQFAKPFIMNTRIESVRIGNPTETKDAANVVLGRLVFVVRVPESVQDIEPRDLDGYTTQVLIGTSSSGYVYSGDNVPVLEPTCAPVAVLINDELLANVDSGGTLSFQVVNTFGLEVGYFNYYTQQYIVPASGLDSTVYIKDTAGNTLYLLTISPSTSTDQTILDSIVELNGLSLTPNKSQTNKLIQINRVDGSSVSITPTLNNETNFSGTIENIVVPKNTANQYKTGQIVSFVSQDDGQLKRGRGSSFLVLNINNGFGNTNRFTDTLGGQTYANNIVLDWASWNQITNTVMGIYRLKQGGSTNMISNIQSQPYVVGAYSDWVIPNNNEFLSLFKWNIDRDYLNYSPLNLVVGSGVTRMQTSTLESGSVGFIFNGPSTLIVQSTPASVSFFLIRYFSFSELGL